LGGGWAGQYKYTVPLGRIAPFSLLGATKMASRWDAGGTLGVPVGRMGRWGCWASLWDGFGGVEYQPALIFNANFVNHIWACPN